MNWISIKNDPTNNRGVPDRIFIKEGKCFFVEFKSKCGELSKTQQAYIDKLNEDVVAPVFVVSDFDEFKGCINGCEGFMVIHRSMLLAGGPRGLV